MRDRNCGRNVTEDPDAPITINISLNADKDNKFSTFELMISLLNASNNVEKKGKTDQDLYVGNTKKFFNMLGDMAEDSEDVRWTLHIPFFDNIAESDHHEAYCMRISQSNSEEAAKLLENNPNKVNALFEWLRSN